MKQYRVNERIRVSQIRVIGDDGAQLGVMTPPDALRLARERGLDLVEVAAQNVPPVCRIMDFNKFRYDEQRRERDAKRKHHVAKLKEVKFKPHIDNHDYHVKLSMLKRFLMRGDQAKVTMVYRGREMAHTELGRRILERLIKDLEPISKVERTPQLDGRFMTMVFGPDREKIKRLERQLARQKTSTTPAGAKSSTTTVAAAAPTPAASDEGSQPAGGLRGDGSAATEGR